MSDTRLCRMNPTLYLNVYLSSSKSDKKTMISFIASYQQMYFLSAFILQLAKFAIIDYVQSYLLARVN